MNSHDLLDVIFKAQTDAGGVPVSVYTTTDKGNLVALKSAEIVTQRDSSGDYQIVVVKR